MPDTSHQPDAASKQTIHQCGDAVRESEHHRDDDHGLDEEPEAGQPQFDAVPPIEESGHSHSVRHNAPCQNELVPAADSTTCVIAGGGPAGMILGLLLARGGVTVVVMEKHADFLRDFRGDTVHASTLRLLDELGLGPKFEQMPHRLIESIRMQFQGVPIAVRLDRLPGRHKHIALAPQWDFLELVATAAEAEPTFRFCAAPKCSDRCCATGG